MQLICVKQSISTIALITKVVKTGKFPPKKQFSMDYISAAVASILEKPNREGSDWRSRKTT
jgi:hypothetical protein